MIFHFLLCLLTVLPSSISTLHGAQYYNLNLIYNTFNGQYWRWRNISNTIPDPSRWDFTNYADPCANQWQGVICDSGNLTIVELSLSDYNLSGTFIDPIFTNLTTIEYLDLSLNKIKGSLPKSLYYLRNLKNISFNENSISGNINRSIQNFTSLQHFDLSLNKLSGVIPDTLYDCDKLDYFNLTGNPQLSGSLSNQLGKLYRLRVLSIGSCNLSYTVPSSIGNLSKLEYLYLGYNKLSGSLPSSLGNLTNLERLVFWFNDLNGTIPDTIYLLRKLSVLDLSTNFRLTGTISENIQFLPNLEQIWLIESALYGPLPKSISELKKLQILSVQTNFLTGEIPSGYGDIKSLKFLQLQNNRLDSTIPASVSNLADVEIFDVSNNLITGRIPSEFSLLKKLSKLYLYTNQLDGTIPSQLGLISNLTELSLNDNKLNGPLPASIFSLNQLQTLLLQNNQLTGKLVAGSQLSLESIDISNNLFSSTFPSELFASSPKLKFISAISNCFSGSLPSSICMSTGLENLLMDGLGGNINCPERASNIFDVSTFGGSIPSCLWQLPKIQRVHLAGNGLTGYLPESGHSIGKNLNYINIAHNSIKGTISNELGSLKFIEFDVSHNKIEGTLDKLKGSQQEPSSSIHCQNNRLSGDVNLEAVNNFSEVNILSENIFGCKSNSELPSKDPNKYDYSCGSNNLDNSIIIWFVMSGIVGIISLAIYYSDYNSEIKVIKILSDFKNYISEIYSVSKSEKMQSFPNLKSFFLLLNEIILYSIKFFSVLLVVSIILLSCLKLPPENRSFLTHEYQYNWMISAAFVTGLESVVVLMLFYICASIALHYTMRRLLKKISPNTRESEAFKNKKNVIWDLKIRIMRLVFLGICLVVIISLNVGYIAIVFAYPRLEILLQIILALFNMVAILSLIPTAIGVFSIYFPLYEADPIRLRSILILFIRIIAPTLSTILTDGNCLYYLFVGTSSINTKYSVQKCLYFNALTLACDIYVPNTFVTSFTPPFNYNSTCRNSIITIYVPVVIFTTFLTTYFAPIMYVLLYINRDKIPKAFMSKNSLIWPEITIFSRRDFILVLITSEIAVILTFGILNPVIIVSSTVSIISNILFWEFNLCRCLSYYLLPPSSSSSSSTISSSAESIPEPKSNIWLIEISAIESTRCFKYAFWPAITISSYFISFILWDMCSDTMPFATCSWVPVIVAMTPLTIWIYNSRRKIKSQILILGKTIFDWNKSPEVPSSGDDISLHLNIKYRFSQYRISNPNLALSGRSTESFEEDQIVSVINPVLCKNQNVPDILTSIKNSL